MYESIELSKADILKYLGIINEKLCIINQKGEINICGGAAMALAYDARDTTYDIDAFYKPKNIMADIIASIAVENGLDSHWLNDDVSMFISELPELSVSKYLVYSNLVVNMVDAKCLLTMKLMSAREDSYDLLDAIILIRHLNIGSVEELYELINAYEGNYHPKAIMESKKFAEIAFQRAK